MPVDHATSALPWWQAFPEDFYRSNNLADVPPWQVGQVKQAAALDKVARLSLACALTAAAFPSLSSERQVARDLEQMAFYKTLADRGNPADVFAEPPAHVDVKTLHAPRLSYHPADISARLMGFHSPFETVNPAARDAYASHTRNRRSVAQYWRQGEHPRPTLIWIHGVVVDPFWLNSLMFSLGWFYRNGYDILLYTLPFHGYRMERRDLLSGMGFFSHGLPHTNEAMLQSVFDLRCWISFLEQQGAPAIGVAGMSLGGYVTTLAASTDKRLAFAIPNVPVVMPADMLMEWQPTGWIFQRMMQQQGIGLTELRHMLAIHSPLTWQPVIPTERLLIIGGAGDRFTSPRYVKALHQHWTGSQLHWFPGNHLLHLRQNEYLHLMQRFMQDAVGAAT